MTASKTKPDRWRQLTEKKRSEFTQLEQLPNVGPAVARDLRLLGIETPQQLLHHNGFDLYQSLCQKTGQRHDPCMLDVLLAAVDFMNGAPAKPWFDYTVDRKIQYPDV